MMMKMTTKRCKTPTTLKSKMKFSNCLNLSKYYSSNLVVSVIFQIKGSKTMSNDCTGIVSRLEAVATRLENLPQLTQTQDMSKTKSACSSDNVTLMEFEQLIKVQFENYSKLSEKIGGDVHKQALLAKKAFLAQVHFLAQAVTRSKPTDSDLKKVLESTSAAINEIITFRENNRRSEHFNHLSAISESIPALSWVTVSPAPCPYIKEMTDASQFYTNRVIKDFKEKDATHQEWTKAWLSVLTELQAFVKKHYTTGLTWHSAGAPATGVQVCPAPPPPPPKPVHSTGSDDTVQHAALFAQLNKGEGVTTGLKKVSDDMKTHKNPDLRAGSTVPAKESPVCSKPGPKQTEVAKPPKMNLDGNKWIVEHFKNKQDIVISDTAIKHTLYVFKCEGSLITVKGKINSIVLDNCKKTALVFDGLISSLDIVNCQSVQVQTLGVLPIVNIDKSDGAQIVLSKESLGVEIISAKSSEMNIVVPTASGDVTEMALPEQFKTKIVNGKLVTSCTEDF